MDRVTKEQAHESAQRLIDVAFGRPDVMARFSIPARREHDDDLIVTRYIDESSSEIASLRAEVARIEAHADHCATGADHWVSVARALRAEVARLKAAMPTAEELESLTAVIDQAWVYDRALARGWLSRVSKGGE